MSFIGLFLAKPRNGIVDGSRHSKDVGFKVVSYGYAPRNGARQFIGLSGPGIDGMPAASRVTVAPGSRVLFFWQQPEPSKPDFPDFSDYNPVKSGD